MQAQGVYASISLGVKASDRATLDQLAEAGLVPEFITIDIARGHADSVRDMIGYIKAKLPQRSVIAGNVATPEAVIDLENWGGDATKVGAGLGKVCITRLKTGFGTGGSTRMGSTRTVSMVRSSPCERRKRFAGVGLGVQFWCTSLKKVRVVAISV